MRFDTENKSLESQIYFVLFIYLNKDNTDALIHEIIIIIFRFFISMQGLFSVKFWPFSQTTKKNCSKWREKQKWRLVDLQDLHPSVIRQLMRPIALIYRRGNVWFRVTLGWTSWSWLQILETSPTLASETVSHRSRIHGVSPSSSALLGGQ